MAKLVKSGKIRLHKGKVNPDEALKAIQAQSEPSTVLRKPASQDHLPVAPTDSRQAVDFVTARTMREAFRAKMARMEYEEKAGKLTDAAKVRDDAFRAGRMLRDALLGIPDRLADVLAAEEDSLAVRQLLENEIEQALEKLANID